MDTRDTIVITGMGRSGTTWLGDLINYKNEYRILFEPLNPTQGVEINRVFYAQPYLRPDRRDEQRVTMIHDLLTGRYHNSFTDQFLTPQSPDAPLMVKEIHFNLMLKWMHEQFRGLKLVYILRHPGAVVFSNLQMGWGLKTFKLILQQDDLVADHLQPFVPLLQGALTPFQERLYLWCVMQYVLFQQFKPGEIQWVFYENLAREPLETLRPLFASLGKPLDETAMLPLTARASKTTYDQSTGSTSTVNVSAKWQQQFTPAQIEQLYETLDCFGLGGLYSRDTLQPDMNVARKLMESKPQPDTRLIAKWNRKKQLRSLFASVKRLARFK